MITVGTLTAGDGFNIIPEKANFNGTIRTINNETRLRVESDFKRMVEGMGQAMNLKASISYQSDYPVTINNHEQANYVGEIATNQFGLEAISYLEQPSMASEDFAYYLQEIPGCFVFLGVKDDEGGAFKLHSDHFLPNAEAMKYGIGLYISLALNPFQTK